MRPEVIPALWHRENAVPVVCGVVNAIASLAMLLLLAPGTELEPDATRRMLFVQEHLATWRIGWLIWMAAALSLVALFAWWAERLRWSRIALLGLALGVAGVVVDLACESLFISVLPDRMDLLPGIAFVDAAIANGLYSVGGALLTVATRSLRGYQLVWTWAVWLAGLLLAGAAILGSLAIEQVSGALLFALFCPWCVFVGPRLR